ncbi:MAG: hypothetical protein EXS08_15035 [Planctomycetes bacterium]|nr:hypothetical protein [Planctomycetota bacterium]
MNARPAGCAELALAALYLAPTPEREGALRRAAAAPLDWDAALVALEAHGLLGLARRNLARALVALPPGVQARLDERAAVLCAIERGFRLTLERFLRAAAEVGVELTLLKGASLALDLYPERGLRAQGDLDLLVRARDVPAAVAAARRIGLALPERALPAWWYRLAHFHLKLTPLDGVQREVELHWHLHPLAQLYTLELEALFARRVALDLAGTRAFTLEPLDRLLHLVTHLVRHCPLAWIERDELLALAADPRAPLRLKWLLDIVAEIERRHASLAVEALARRAAEWNAENDLALVLGWLRTQLGFAAAAQDWVVRALAALPAPEVPTRRGHAPVSERPLPGLDFRPSALRAFPRWVWPRAGRFGRLSGNGPRALVRRTGHAARVLARGAALLVLTPVAWLARRAERTPLGPEATLELAVRARELERAEPRSTSS